LQIKLYHKTSLYRPFALVSATTEALKTSDFPAGEAGAKRPPFLRAKRRWIINPKAVITFLKKKEVYNDKQEIIHAKNIRSFETKVGKRHL
jgi:hypothetical protein